MQQQLIDTYMGIMASLATLPDDIAGYQNDVTDAKLKKGEVEKELARLDGAIIAAAGGYKGLGSNEKERELALDNLRKTHPAWKQLDAQLSTLTRTVAEMADEVSAAERQYGAACYMARMHAALLTYLGNAGAPAGDVVLPTADFFTMSDARFAARNGNGAATVADAAELGL